MNLSQLIIFGYFSASAFLLGQCVLQTISTQSAETSPDNFIGFDFNSDKVADGSAVRVRYQCFRPCQLGVEVVVSTLGKTDSVVFRKKWINMATRVIRVQQVLLRLPWSFSHHHDFSNKNMSGGRNVTVRAWLDYRKRDSTYHGSMLRIYKVMQVTPLSKSPRKPPTGCRSWSAQLMSSKTHQCPHESDVIDMLKFPLASTGEHFGVVRKFHPFNNKNLERARLHAVTQPNVTFSVWIYLLKWCHTKLCGIIHHVNRRNLYDSVLMQLTDTGDIIIQARVTKGADEAFRANVALPLWKWIRLDCYILDSKVRLHATWDEKTRESTYQFQKSIRFDDTDGYFVIGGGKYIAGIHGYFGPTKYFRLGAKKIKNELQPESLLQELEGVHKECQETKAFTNAFIKEATTSQPFSSTSEAVCIPDFLRLLGQFQEKNQTCTQTWSWDLLRKHNMFLHFLQKRNREIRAAGSWSVKNLGSALFTLAVGSMFPADEAETKIQSESMALLEVSSCFGNHRASLLLAAIHLSGLGQSANQQKGHIYSLIGASGDDRFALMHAGYKHMHGTDGFPRDQDMAYSYYSNAGAQSNIDSSHMHENKQYTPESIYLCNEEDLKSLTDESSDLFQFMKHQAERGDVESQRRLGTMLYWGRHGLSKDIASAVKWFERSAIQMKDPSAMYDYAILLMKGLGVKRNQTRGFQLLKKAAALGSINALNGLGWYHGTVLKDHRNAVRYFEQAASNGSDDGMFNLGVYHLSGKNLDRPERNESAAVLQFLKASRLGHVAASVEAARYLSMGGLRGLSQDVERAVILLKKVCEGNGYLGFMIRESLQAYLQGSWQKTFAGYVLAAEAGLGFAQSNVAHLCEELDLTCQWRYYNFSLLNSDPHPSTLLKMGDYYYHGYSSSTREDSLSLAEQAVSMYSRAALAGSPQALYNLALLARDGHVLPQNLLSLLNATRQDEPDAVVEKILEKCVEATDKEALTPCALALLGLQMGKAWSRMTQSRPQLFLIYGSGFSIFLSVIAVVMHSCLEKKERDRSPSSGRGVDSNTMQSRAPLRPLNARHYTDVALTLSGTCMCAFCTTFLYHLL